MSENDPTLPDPDPGELLARAMHTDQPSGAAGGGRWTPPTPEELAELLPQYRIETLLGHGGMGAVYKGVQVALKRPVAIKLLPLEVSADPAFAKRFEHEAQTLAKLSHPNIVAVHDFGTTSEGHLYFVMEFVEGTDLHKMIHGPGLSPAQSLSIIIAVCEALQYAHGKGVVHRDIKPANVMVSTEGTVKVADFGLARLNTPDADSGGLTMTGTVMGTPAYMAPEQTRGMAVDHRADIYSLGVMLYEMLCGEIPRGVFDPPSHKVQVDVRLDEVVLKAMHSEPERRYQNTVEMKTDVDRIRTTPAQRKPAPKPRAKSPVAAIIAVCLALASAAGFFIWEKRNASRAPHVQAESAAQSSHALQRVEAPQTPGSADGLKPSTTLPAAPTPLEPGAIRLWDSAAKVPANSEGVAWKDDALFINSANLHALRTSSPTSAIKNRDSIIRFSLRMNADARWANVAVRSTGSAKEPRAYQLRINPSGGHLDLGVSAGGSHRKLRVWKMPELYRRDDWMRVELRMVGDALTVSVDGKALETIRDATLPGPGMTTLGATTNCYFRDIVYVPLDQPDATAASAGATPAGPDPAILEVQHFGGHRYQFAPGGYSWDKAKARAEAMGGHLATVGSAEENEFLITKFKGQVQATKNVFLGATREKSDAPWTWVTGEPFTFQDWPAKRAGGAVTSESYPLALVLWRDPINNRVIWHDETQSNAHRRVGFIVEWDDDGSAKPGEAALSGGTRSVVSPTSAGAGGGKVGADGASPSTATKDAPFVNTLGMKFVPVPIPGGPTGGQRVLFSIWETRVQDYEAFTKETKRKWPKPSFQRDALEPAVNVSWDNGVAFCAWLTDRETKAGTITASQSYRLPTDHEWSCAVGIGEREDASKAPLDKSGKLPEEFPWGRTWPPPATAGNYNGQEAIGKQILPGQEIIEGFSDGFSATAPVGSFIPNPLGLFDLGGNAWEWCDDPSRPTRDARILRGAAFSTGGKVFLLSSNRAARPPSSREAGNDGFRVVLAPVAP